MLQLDPQRINATYNPGFELGLLAGNAEIAVIVSALRYSEETGRIDFLLPVSSEVGHRLSVVSTEITSGPTLAQQRSPGWLAANAAALDRLRSCGYECEAAERLLEIEAGHSYTVRIDGSDYRLTVRTIHGETIGRRLIELTGSGMHRILREDAFEIIG